MRIRLSTLLLLVAVAPTPYPTHAMSSLGHTEPDPSEVISSLAPAAPTNLDFSVVGTTVNLIWTAPVTGDPPTGYVVEASFTSGGPVVASVLVSGTARSVPNVPPGTYYVRVRAMNADGISSPSNQVVVSVGNVCAAPPNAPVNLLSTVSGNMVALDWNAPAAGCPVTHYVVRAGSAPGLTNLVPGFSVGLNTALMVSAPTGTYYVTVVAMNAFGASAPSNEVRVVAGVCTTAPAAPIAFSASTVGSTAALSWAPSPAGGAPTSYVLEAGSFSGGSNLAVLSLPGTSFSAAGVPAGTYFVRTRAVNSCGTSPASLERTLTIGVCTPSAPGSPSSPSAAVSGSNATISWNAVSNATSYRLDVGTASGTSNILSETITGTSRQLSGLSSATYFMRVTAQNECGAGASSAEATFTIGSPLTVTSVAVAGTSPIPSGQSAQYTATATFSNGSTQNVTSSSTWSSSNTAVVTVNAGLVTAVAAGSADVRATYQGITGARTVQVSTAAPNATFTVITDPDTIPLGVNPGQCAISQIGPQNVVRCTFDASLSTPNPGITSYAWDIPIKVGDTSFSGMVAQGIGVQCGNLSFTSGTAERQVTLTVTAGGVSHSVTKTVTFVRAGAC